MESDLNGIDFRSFHSLIKALQGKRRRAASGKQAAAGYSPPFINRTLPTLTHTCERLRFIFMNPGP